MRTGPLLLQETDGALWERAEEHQLQLETCWERGEEQEMLRGMEVKPGVSVRVLVQVWVDRWMEEAREGNTEDLLNAGGAPHFSQTQEHAGKELETL